VSGGANAKSSLFPDRKVKSSNETARTLYNVMTSVNTMLDKRQDCRLSTVSTLTLSPPLSVDSRSPSNPAGRRDIRSPFSPSPPCPQVLDFEEVTKQTSQMELQYSLEPSDTSPDEASSSELTPKSDVHASVFKHGLSCGRYKFVATLGEGSSAVCFTVMKVDTSELCVLKVRFPSHHTPSRL